jgi:cellulose biosynthesis protein BcsQ
VSKIQLVIADEESDYLEHVLHYIRTTDYADRFIVKTFSGKDSLEEYMHTGSTIHLLLVQPKLLRNESAQSSVIHTTIHLIDQSHRPDDNTLSVFKYQPLHQLLSNVLTLHLENHGGTLRSNTNKRKTQVVSVYSASGGSGKTTLAINLAKESANLGSRIFYLNLEFLCTFGRYFTITGEDLFSKLLYYVKSNQKQLLTRFEQLKQHDPSTKIDFFEPLTNPEEILEMNMEEIGQIITSIVQSNLYDLIVIDLDSTTHQKNISAMLKSDVIIWLVTDDIHIIDKTQLLLRELKRLLGEDYATVFGSTKFILNKYTGQIANQFDQFFIELYEKLPYVPEWKSVSGPEQMLMATSYNSRVRKLYQSLLSVWESERI